VFGINKKMLEQIFENKIGQIVVSVILGLGLATVFKRVCTGDNCIVIESPDMKEINKYYYKIDEQCYKYKPYATTCDKAN
jgi:hypothetical protein